METSTNLLFLILLTIPSFALGAGFAWWIFKGQADIAREQGRGEGRGELATLQERTRNFENEVGQLQERLREIEARHHTLNEEKNQLSNAKTEIETILKEERGQTEEKLGLLNTAKDTLTTQFKVLAAEILDEKTKKFTEKNAENLSAILNPFTEKLSEFKTKVEETYDKESKIRFSLQEEIKRLVTTTTQISTDATNLTQALKGESKTQGTWGEMILERVLERSGLSKGREYEVQESFQQEDGSRVQPDVIVYLPDERQVVIDSKVSLTGYERFCSEENVEDRPTHLKSHIASLRAHVNALSNKNYQNLYQLNSLDFVVMFIPIEAAFHTGHAEDPELFIEAFNKNVMIVSPTTLLPTLRTIAHIWRQEHQSRHSQEISRLAATLYDKLVGFVNNLEMIGKKLDDAKNAQEDAIKQLATGRGNLIRQAEKFKELGVQPTKSLPEKLLDTAKADEEIESLAEKE